jgi:hypothetical protein
MLLAFALNDDGWSRAATRGNSVGAEDGGVVLEYTVAQLAHNYPKHRRRSPRERSERRRQLL